MTRVVGAPRSDGHGWQRAWCYVLFFVAPLSIAAANLASFMLLFGVIYQRLRGPFGERLPAALWLPYAALAAVGLLASLTSTLPALSLSMVGGDVRVLLLPLVGFLALRSVDEDRLVRVLAVSVALASAYGVVQYFWGVAWHPADEPPAPMGNRFRAEGTFTHPLTYGGILLLLAPVFLSLFLSDRRPLRWIWLAVGVLATAALIMSGTRSVHIGLGVAVVVLLYRVRRWLGLAVGGGALVFGVAFTLLVLHGGASRFVDIEAAPPLVKRYLDIDLGNANILTRLYLWEAALLGWQERPLVGFGVNGHRWAFAGYMRHVSRRHGDFRFQAGYGSNVHNVYLRVLFEMGALGLLAYLALWGTVLWWLGSTLARPPPPGQTVARGVLWGIGAGLAGSAAEGMFEDHFFDAEVQIVVLLLFALTYRLGHRLRHPAGAPAPDRADAGGGAVQGAAAGP